MKIAFETLGCKLNQAETESLARQFSGAGHTIATSVDEADIYILNTCTVTGMADSKSRQLLRRARRRNPAARLVVTGCYAERSARELAGIDGVVVAVGNDEKESLLRLLEESSCLDAPASSNSAGNIKSTLRTRSFIKIQDGCNNFCAYCIVPLVRGREKNRPAGRIIEEVGQRAAEGMLEVVLTGTEIGAYKDGDSRLGELIEGILAGTDIARLRLSSLQPDEITPGFLSLWRDTRLCPHFHLPLQSGSDAVLRRMKRRYGVAGYEKALSLIREQVPDAAITTDVIVGFPGETEEEFEETLESCRRAGFSRIHVFPYSRRPGTEAAGMAGQVSDRDRTQRNRKLRALASLCISEYGRGFSGWSMSVLWEKRTGGLWTWTGHTGNYIKVYARSSRDLANKITPVIIGEIYRDGVWGELVKESGGRL